MNFWLRFDLAVLTLGLGTLPWTTGCSYLDFASPRTAGDSTVHGLIGEQFTTAAVGSDEPNDILIHIHVPLSLISSGIIRRTTHSTGLNEMIDIRNGGDFSDGNLKPKETYTYELGSIVDGQFKTVCESTITVPEDLVVHGIQEIDPAVTTSFAPFRIFIRTGTNKQKRLMMTSAGFVTGAAIGNLRPAEPQKNAVMYASLIGLGAAITSEFIFDDEIELARLRRESDRLKHDNEILKAETEPQLRSSGNNLLTSPLPQDVQKLVRPGNWRRFKIDRWAHDDDNENQWIRQTEIFEITPPSSGSH